MPDIKHDFDVVSTDSPTDGNMVFRSEVNFPGFGIMVITFEQDTEALYGPRPVLEFGFEPSAVTVIDQQGTTRLISV